MKISIIKSANEVVIGSKQVTNDKLARLIIGANDIKNNLKQKRHTHWVKVSFKGEGTIELGDETVYIGDYDEYPISPDTKMIVPVENTDKGNNQYVCSKLSVVTLLQNKALIEDEEIIIVYTRLENEEVASNKINTMLLQAMKKCLFQYQMKAYKDYEGEEINTVLFNERVEQIANILPVLETLIEQQTDQN